MPADERIKVTFRRVYVYKDADWFGSGEFYFVATVDGRPVGDKKKIFDAVEKTWINLPDAEWSAVVDVAAKASVKVTFRGYDEDVFFDDDLGGITHTINPPWTESTYKHDTEYFHVEWDVELAITGAFGRHAPTDVFACRQHAGSVLCTTVNGSSVTSRLEIHPVAPMPPDAAVLPPAPVIFPPRPVFPPGTSAAKYNTAVNAGATVTAASPLNVIPNPPVIPILSPPPPAPAPAAGAPPAATADNTARIEFTYYRPDSLAFTDDDARLEWSATSIGAGAVAFFGPARGLKVKVYGTTAGEVLLTVRFKGAVFATYRALVRAVKDIPSRFNILNGPPGSRPRVSPADVVNHVAIANRFLRQVGIQLVFDTNKTVRDGATTTAVDGVFRISVAAGVTRNFSDTGHPKATRLNFRDNVANFAYVFSDSDPGDLGRATDRPASKAGASITDAGTPSASWILPTGVDPDAAAGTVTMALRPVMQALKSDGTPRFPNLFAMYLTDRNGNPATNALTYANTLAHEFGHILNLGHRQPTGGDGIGHPPAENLMHGTNGPAVAQDLDIIQARAVHQSPLVPP